MAKLNIYPIDPMVKELERMGRMDEVAPKMIDGGMPYVVDAIKDALQTHRDTGNLINSVAANKAKKTKRGGYYASTKFKGYDPYSYKTADYPRGTPNAVKAMGLEYGSIHESARPFLQKALNDAWKDVVEYMQLIYNLEVGRGRSNG